MPYLNILCDFRDIIRQKGSLAVSAVCSVFVIIDKVFFRSWKSFDKPLEVLGELLYAVVSYRKTHVILSGMGLDFGRI